MVHEPAAGGLAFRGKRRPLLDGSLCDQVVNEPALGITGADERETAPEHGREWSAAGASIDDPARRLGPLDRKPHLRPAGIDEPELTHARRMLGGREPLRILSHRRIADDFDDDIGSSFEFHKPVGPTSRRRHQPHPPAFERDF